MGVYQPIKFNQNKERLIHTKYWGCNTIFRYTCMNWLFLYICKAFNSDTEQRMKKPNDCKNRDEIRCAIDMLDKKIIELLGERFSYVKAIVKYKETNKNSIIAKERYNEVIRSRRIWAKENGLNPEIIGEMYTMLLNHFIQEEMNIIESKK
jgi:isochorismate pyruvate lyase